VEAPVRHPHQGTTTGRVLLNIVNLYIGMGLLSMPYAIKLGGWWGIAGLVLTTLLFCLSAILIVGAFSFLPAGAPHTYPGTLSHAWCVYMPGYT
jgi:amino acid permease